MTIRRVVLAIAMCVGALLWVGIIFGVALAFGQTPPRQYQQGTRVVVQFESAQNVASMCSLITSGRLQNRAACANTEIIIAPNPCDYGGRYAEIMCHELAHVNGWGADHRRS